MTTMVEDFFDLSVESLTFETVGKCGSTGPTGENKVHSETREFASGIGARMHSSHSPHLRCVLPVRHLEQMGRWSMLQTCMGNSPPVCRHNSRRRTSTAHSAHKSARA